ncbi:hypothetical protein D3C80_1376560 [compost metagenome]
MTFKDIYVNVSERYAIGIEVTSGKYYLSIPVSNGMVDYEEYYEITESEFNDYRENENKTFQVAEKCRNRKVDERLIIKPGSNRGVAV